MAATFTLDKTILGAQDATEREGIYVGTVTFSGSYTAGGDTLNLANDQSIVSQVAPVRCEIYEEPSSSQTSTGYQFVYAKGTTLANGKIQINSSQGNPFSGSYGTTFASTKVRCRFWVPRGQ